MLKEECIFRRKSIKMNLIEFLQVCSKICGLRRRIACVCCFLDILFSEKLFFVQISHALIFSNLSILINYYIKGGKIQEMNKSLEPLTDTSISSQSSNEQCPTKIRRFGISPSLNLKNWTPGNVTSYQISHVLKIRDLSRKIKWFIYRISSFYYISP